MSRTSSSAGGSSSPRGSCRPRWTATKYPNTVAWFENNETDGWYRVILDVLGPGQQATTNLQEWGFGDWWPTFSKEHKDGPVVTYDWPRSRRRS